MKHKVESFETSFQHTTVGDLSSSRGLDPEEARIFLKSLPTEEVTRDFLQELLEEHRVNRKANGAKGAGL